MLVPWTYVDMRYVESAGEYIATYRNILKSLYILGLGPQISESDILCHQRRKVVDLKRKLNIISKGHKNMSIQSVLLRKLRINHDQE